MMTGAEVSSLAKRTYAAWSEDKASRLAAALALYTMLSLAPLLVITIKIVAVALGDEAATDQVKMGVQDYVGPAAGEAVQEMIAKAGRPGEGRVATFVSTALLIFGATALFTSIQDALNTIWGVKPRPGQGIRATIGVRFRSLLLVLTVAALLLGSVVLSNVIHTLSDNIGGGLVAASYVADLLVSLGVSTALFALLFKFLPDVKLKWRDVWLGAAVTSVLFALGKYALTFYFSKAAPASAFGAAGSLAALLVWVYYSGMIAFLGVEFTKVYFLHRRERIVPLPHAVLLTGGDRAVEGIPKLAAVERAVAEEREAPAAIGPPETTSDSTAPPKLRETRTFHPTSLALGAVATGVAAWCLRRGKDTAVRREAAALRLGDRIRDVESRLGPVSRVRDDLRRADVSDRIDRVERSIRRAGLNVRAKESGRPPWMVRLAELIGGRRSGL